MIIYGSGLSPYVRKVLVAAMTKGLQFQHDPIVPLPDRITKEFSAASPFHKIPALSDGAFDLSDSTAICTYFEAIAPHPPLLPSEPRDRATTVWMEEFSDTILTPVISTIFANRVAAPVLLGIAGDERAAAQAETVELPAPLDYIEQRLRNGDMLVGETTTIADLAVASALINLRHADVEYTQGRPALARWAEDLHRSAIFSRLLDLEARELETLKAARSNADMR